jgi:hypothetical protein
MFHGIYLKTKPKNKWLLYSIAVSQEAANYDLGQALKQAQSEGNEQAEAAVKTFTDGFYVPEILNEIEGSKKPLFN